MKKYLKHVNRPRILLFLIIVDCIFIGIYTIDWVSSQLHTVTYSYYSNNFTLQPHDEIGQDEIVKNWPVYIDGTIEKINYEIIGASRLNLHHIVFAYGGKQDYVCPQLPARLAGTGKELTNINFPTGYGYNVKRGNMFMGDIHFNNPTENTYKNVKIKINVTMRKKGLLNFDKPIQPIWYDILNCSFHPTVWIEPNSNKEFTINPKITIPFDGNIVHSTSHFHDFAYMMELYLDGEKLQSFKSISNLEAIDRIEPYIIEKNILSVKKGQTLDGSVKYENTTDKPIDGMGLGVIFLAKD